MTGSSLGLHLGQSLRNPEFWALSSWLDIVAKARQSRLGVLWLLAPSNFYVWGLGSFFAGLQGRSLAEFAAHIALGAMIFRLVSGIVVESTNVFLAHQAFIMDGHVRLTDFMLRTVAKMLFHFVMALPAIGVALWIYPELQTTGFLWLLLSLPLVLLNAFWMGLVLALLGARSPDVGQFTGNIFIFAFLLTPIIWYAEWAPADSVRGQFMRLNPFFHLVEVIRSPLLGQPLEVGSLYYLAGMTVLGCSLAAWLYRRYAHYVPLWI